MSTMQVCAQVSQRADGLMNCSSQRLLRPVWNNHTRARTCLQHRCFALSEVRSSAERDQAKMISSFQ